MPKAKSIRVKRQKKDKRLIAIHFADAPKILRYFEESGVGELECAA